MGELGCGRSGARHVVMWEQWDMVGRSGDEIMGQEEAHGSPCWHLNLLLVGDEYALLHLVAGLYFGHAFGVLHTSPSQR